jgi:hypothetical protein
MRILMLIAVLIGYVTADKAWTDLSFTGNKLIFTTKDPNLILDMVEYYPYYTNLCYTLSNELNVCYNRIDVYKKKEKNRNKMDETKTGIMKLSKEKRIIIGVLVVSGAVLLSYGAGTLTGILLVR